MKWANPDKCSYSDKRGKVPLLPEGFFALAVFMLLFVTSPSFSMTRFFLATVAMILSYYLYRVTLETGSARVSTLNTILLAVFMVVALTWCAYGILVKRGSGTDQIVAFWTVMILTGVAAIFIGYRRHLSRMESDPPPGRYDYERGLFDPWVMITPRNKVGAVFTRYFWSVSGLVVGTGLWFSLHLSKTNPHKADTYTIFGTFLATWLIGLAIGTGIAGARLIRRWERKTGRAMRLASFSDAADLR